MFSVAKLKRGLKEDMEKYEAEKAEKEKIWDQWYLDICNKISEHSKCLSRKVGAILVKDRTIISQGYNGPPRGIPHCGVERQKFDKNLYEIYSGIITEEHYKTCPRQILGFRSGEGLDFCIAGHAERNCLINAARHGIATKDSIMYMNCGIPCTPCLIEIINAGVTSIVVTDKSKYYDREAEFILTNSGLDVRNYFEYRI